MNWNNLEYILNNMLPERERIIFVSRWHKVKYKVLAKQFNISTSRVQQIFLRTRERVEDYLEKFKNNKLWID